MSKSGTKQFTDHINEIMKRNEWATYWQMAKALDGELTNTLRNWCKGNFVRYPTEKAIKTFLKKLSEHGYDMPSDDILLPNKSVDAIVKEKGIENKKPKFDLICFGSNTVFLTTGKFNFSWERIWKHYDLNNEVRKENFLAYYRGKKSYYEFINFYHAAFKERGMKKEDFLSIVKGIRLRRNTEFTLEILAHYMTPLERKRRPLVMISGGLDEFLKAAWVGYEHYFGEVYINNFSFDSNGDLTFVFKITPYDYAPYVNPDKRDYKDQKILGKDVCIQRLCEKYGIDPARVLFVGRGAQDDDVVGKAFKCCTFPDPGTIMQERYDHVLPSHDFAGLLDYVFEPSKDKTPSYEYAK